MRTYITTPEFILVSELIQKGTKVYDFNPHKLEAKSITQNCFQAIHFKSDPPSFSPFVHSGAITDPFTNLLFYFTPTLSTFVSNQTVCMSFSDVWSPNSCLTTYDTESNYIICQCTMLAASRVAVRHDATRERGPDVPWKVSLTSEENKGYGYYVLPMVMVVWVVIGIVVTSRLH